MKLTTEQRRAVEKGEPVRLRNEGLDCVVIRADLYDRVANSVGSGNPLIQNRNLGPGSGASVRQRGERIAPDPSEPWTEDRNERRCELIDKDIEGTHTEAEKWELERLQDCFHEYLDTVAPPPLEGAQRLHRQLLEDKRRRER